jgi:hypothetical protein
LPTGGGVVYEYGAMRTSFVLGLLLATGCATGCAAAPDDSAVDDAEGETGAALDHGADAASLTGTYRWSYATRPYWNNDIPSLQLDAGSYVRSRCYGWDCEKLVPQVGTVEVVQSSSHKTYLRFMSFEKSLVGDEWIEEPVVADTYEVLPTEHGIKLRKTYTSRWFYLRAVTPEDACTQSGGEWSAGACACPGEGEGDWSHYTAFFYGLGGCFEIFATGEDGCDQSHGSYTDDDATAIGTYCICPVGTYETTGGCETI